MMNNSIKKIHIDEIKADMILAEDAVNEKGFVVLSKNTMLNNINYTKLKAHEIDELSVRAHSINDQAPDIQTEKATLEMQKIPVIEREEFKTFYTIYQEKKEQLKKYIHAISDGAVINLEELYQLTGGIMDQLKFKSDIFTFIGFIKDSDEHTYTHSNNVSLLCNLFGHWLGLPSEEHMYLTTAGLLHDIGKTKISPQILNKRGRLTEEEFEEMKRHTTYGYRILQNQNIPEDIKLSALMHHERIDGSGYPLGATAEQINRLAKIVSVCDIYDAMTANRVYRDKICPFEVIRTFERKMYGELETEYLLVFLKNIAYTYVGNWVSLSDQTEAEVLFINQGNLSRPIVRRLDGAIIDLSHNHEISIISLV